MFTQSSVSEPIEKPAFSSISDDLRRQVQELAPQAFDAEGNLDLESLARAMGIEPQLSETRFGLTWPGKETAVAMASMRHGSTLYPDPQASKDFETTRNVFVEADNLVALQLLRNAYAGRVKLIYVDPPYNTGDDFIYKDDFQSPRDAYWAQTTISDEAGKRTKAKSTTESGRKHSSWLNFMYPRLMLARQMLRRDGAIMVACDDNEVANLRLIMEEIFGSENFVATMVWQGGRKNDAKLVSVGHDYMIVFARDRDRLKEIDASWHVRKEGLEAVYAQVDSILAYVGAEYGGDLSIATEMLKKWYKDLDSGHPAKAIDHYDHIDCHADRGHVFFPDNISWPGGGGPTYPVLHPVTGKPVSLPSSGWRLSKPETMASMISEDRILFGDDENKVPNFKRYLKDTEFWAPGSVIYQDRRSASKRLKTLLGGPFFDFPKDETVIARFVDAITDDGDIVMDFFAGSGSTGHAVWLQNAKDGKDRRFVLVTLPEIVDAKSEARKAGYITISEITIERLRRAGDKVRADNPNVSCDVGFRLFRQAWTSRTRRELTAANEVELFEAFTALTLEMDQVQDSKVAHVVWREALRAGFMLDAKIETLDEGIWRIKDTNRSAWIAMPKRSGQLRERLVAVGAVRNDEVILIERANSASDSANCSAYFNLKPVLA